MIIPKYFWTVETAQKRLQMEKSTGFPLFWQKVYTKRKKFPLGLRIPKRYILLTVTTHQQHAPPLL